MYLISEGTKEAIEDRLGLRLRYENIGLEDIVFEEDCIKIEFVDKDNGINRESIGVTRERVAVNLLRAMNKYLEIYLELETDEYCFENGQANKMIFRFYK